MLLVVQGYTVVTLFSYSMQASRKSISKGRQLSNCVYESQDAPVESGSRAATESKTILHFTVVCLVAKPLNRSEATGDLVVIQTFLLSICKSFCYHAN